MNENGSVMTAALLVLSLMLLLGLAASSSTTVEIQIATNDQFTKMAFYNADSALYGAAKLVSLSIDEDRAIAAGPGTRAPGIVYLNTGTDFYRRIAGLSDDDTEEPDLDFSAGGIDATVHVRRIRHRYADGGGVEFGAGADGVAAGMVVIEYEINAKGTTPRGATSELSAIYRKVVGSSGGL
ncbi:hypothetical protein LJC71_00045 [Desulfosarcina sp. OttesenSCG-928-A07]|nr:hypothetical protein [Desulfosarcina sp. OttesenSCG-928-A07]